MNNEGVLYTCWGETKSVMAWSKDPRCKISYTGLRHRLQSGINIEEALMGSKEGWRKSKVKIGKKFGRLILKEIIPGKTNNKIRQKGKFQCDCGNIVTKELFKVSSGNTSSCGCLRKEELGNRSRTHGYGNSILLIKLHSAISRCHNINNSKYMSYGGRGIKVCDEWRKNPTLFVEWALENGWHEGMKCELDRKDENYHYCSDNCRLATRKEGLISSKNNRQLLAWGEIKSILHWSKDKRCNMDIENIHNRLSLGWSTEDAIYMPYPS